MTFRGEITSVDSELAGTFSIGDATEMTVTLDEPIVPTNPGLDFAKYSAELTSVNFGGYSFTSTDTSVNVYPPTSPSDASDIIFFAVNRGSGIAAPVGGLELGSGPVELVADAPTVLNGSTAFPTDFTRSDFRSATWAMVFLVQSESGGTIGTRRANSSVTSVTVSNPLTPVPLPAGVWMLGTALGTLVVAQRRRVAG